MSNDNFPDEKVSLSLVLLELMMAEDGWRKRANNVDDEDEAVAQDERTHCLTAANTCMLLRNRLIQRFREPSKVEPVSLETRSGGSSRCSVCRGQLYAFNLCVPCRAIGLDHCVACHKPTNQEICMCPRCI